MAKKILIIEADPTALRLTEYTLKQRGYQVITTSNGLEGIITAQKEAPDLIILDVMLPGVDGYEVCKRLRAGIQTAEIPILIISGKAREEDIAVGFKAGANDYLPKPATPSNIIARVERLLLVRPDSKMGIITFLNPGEIPGMTVLLSEIAAALNELDKQVTLVEVGPAAGNKTKAPQEAHGRVILETTPGDAEKSGPACETLPSGIRLLHVTENAEDASDAMQNSLQVLRGMCGTTDYLLIDLPFKPSPFTRSLLASAELAVIASGYKIKDLGELHNIVKLLNFSDVPLSKIAGLLVDTAGDFSAASLGSIKPYFEANLGIDLAGTVSFDAKTYQLSYLENQPIIKSGLNNQFGISIRQIARYVIAHDVMKLDPLRIPSAPRAEKGK
ncbi:MAG TPA: response regulator [Dehalococcoidales bacterium]|nr:response regulator [Dehalococcoidales bacterium]